MSGLQRDRRRDCVAQPAAVANPDEGCNHYLCASCWGEVARHDQRCPFCRTDVSEWIRRYLFERDRDGVHWEYGWGCSVLVVRGLLERRSNTYERACRCSHYA